MNIRGVYRFSSLVKQNKKAKNCAVFCCDGKRIFFLYYDVITSPEKEKSSAIQYLCTHVRVCVRVRMCIGACGPVSNILGACGTS